MIGLKVPSDDPEHPAHGYQMFPYGKPQEDAYYEILDHLDETEHGMYEMIEANQQLRERLDDWAMTQVSTPAWLEANDPPADGEPVEPPGEGEGEGEGP